MIAESKSKEQREMTANSKTTKATRMTSRYLAFGAAMLCAATTTLAPDTAEAQEIQLTGPLAGAEAVRNLRLHREGRWDVALHGTFSLLDEYRRTIMPGLRVNYHLKDWLGVGVFGGYGLSYNASLADELQLKAIDNRDCVNNSTLPGCKLTNVNLCRGKDCLSESQLGRLQWYVSPQVTFVPFRGKISLFSKAFIDTDISVFAGAAIIGVQERAECAVGDCPNSFELASRVTAAPTFGLGFNFYPMDFLGFGTEFRATPFAWNTAGFDVAGGGEDGAFPDLQVNSDDRALYVNPMLTAYISMQLPMQIKVSD